MTSKRIEGIALARFIESNILPNAYIYIYIYIIKKMEKVQQHKKLGAGGKT